MQSEVKNEKDAREMVERKLEKTDQMLSDALQDGFVLFARLEASEKSQIDLKNEQKNEKLSH